MPPRRPRAVVNNQGEDQGPNPAPADTPANPGNTSTRSSAQTLQAVIDVLNRTPFATSPEVPDDLESDASPVMVSLIEGLHRLATRTWCAEKTLFETGRLPLASPSRLESPIATMEHQIDSIAQQVPDLSAGSTASRTMLPVIQTQLEDLSQRVPTQSDANRVVRSQEQLADDVRGTVANLGVDLTHIKEHIESVYGALLESKDRKIAEAEDQVHRLELQLQEATTENSDLREMMDDIMGNLAASNSVLQASIDPTKGTPKDAPSAHASSSVSAVDESLSVRKNVDLLVRQSRHFAELLPTLFASSDPDKVLSRARGQSDANLQTLPEIWHLGTEKALAVKNRIQELEGDKLRLEKGLHSFQFVLHQMHKGVYSLDEWQAAAVSQDEATLSEELDLTAAADLVDIARTLQSYRSKYIALAMQIQSRRWSPRPTPSWIPIAH